MKKRLLEIIEIFKKFDYRGTAIRLKDFVTAIVRATPSFLKREVPLLPGRIVKFTKSLPGHWRAVKKFILDYLADLEVNPGTRFLTAAWSVAIVFFSVSALSSSNPFRLLIPGVAFPIPVRDHRDKISIFGLSHESQKPVRVNRLLLLDTNSERLAEKIAFAVSRPLTLTDSEMNPGLDLEVMPDLGFALSRSWKYDLKGRKFLVLDFNRAILNEELQSFMRGRSQTDKKPEAFLDDYFRLLASSVFEVPSIGVDSVVFLIDGNSQAIPGMTFDLKKAYTKSDL